MKLAILFIMGMILSLGSHGSTEVQTYDELVAYVDNAVDDGNIISDSFTNVVMRYKAGETNAEARAAADLAMALNYSQRLDRQEESIGDQMLFTNYCSMVSNLSCNTSLSESSWVRYAAIFQRIRACNEDRDEDAGYVLTTNALASLSIHQVDMTGRNFWRAIMKLEKTPDLSIEDALRLNAAIVLIEKGKETESVAYTNSLSDTALRILANVLQD